MKKLFTLLFTALMSVSLLASPTTVPSETDLALQYDLANNVVLCCYFDVAPCNTVVLVGSYNGWSAVPSECVAFEALNGYDGWWVVEVEYTEGLQAKPLQLNNGTFDGWTYQVGDPNAWVWKAGKQVVLSSTYTGESDVAYPSAGAYIYEVKYWKNNNNPCTAVYHNYTITVVSEGCDGLAVPFLVGGMTCWSFTQMNRDVAMTRQYGTPTYSYSFNAAEGSAYQLLSGLADATGTDVEMPEWEEKAYLQKYVDGEWVRMPGDDDHNLLTKEDTSIVFDLRDTATYRWTRCIESLFHTYTINAKLPTKSAPDSVELVGGWGVDTWNNGILMTYSNGLWTATVDAYDGCLYKFRAYGTWDKELLTYDEDEDGWLTKDLVFDSIETIHLDLSNDELYKWSGEEVPEPQSDYQDYTILLYDPVCEDNPEFSPALFLNGDFVGFEKTLYGDREVWYARVEAVPGTSCHIVELNNTFGNEIQQFDTTTQQWWGMMPSTFPYGTSADGTTLLYDYSDTRLYRYPLCGKLGYDDSTYVDVNVMLKAPAGAPEKVALVGMFVSNNGNSWVTGAPMKYKDGYYTVTVKATLNSQFTFKEYANDTNYIYYTNGTSLENFVFGEYYDDLGNVSVDLSDNSRYKWQVWSDYTPIETYSIVVQSDNTENGTVKGGGEYRKGETAVIMATPRKDCTFAGWSDGNTLNPRSVVVTADAVYTAVFRRNVPLPVVVCSDTMSFASADTTMLAIRVYDPSDIQPYDKLIIATVNNKNVMGFQFVEDAELRNFRTAVEYTKNMPISDVSVVEVVPNGGNYRLRVADGELAPRCEDCTSATNQLYATQVGADWYFAQYDNSVLPEAAAYANRMILYNEEAPRFSSYRQVTGLDRSQTTVFKLHTPRNIPQTPEEIPVDTVSMVEEEKPMEDIPVAIEPKDTVAVISTPYVDFVHTFTLIVWADEAHTQVLLVITYDADGHQLSITRPSAVRRLPAGHAGVTFEVGDLLPNTTYHYTLVACEDDGSILVSLNSTFMTTTTVDVRNVSGESGQIMKLLLNGHILILRGDKTYTLTGQELK